MGKPIVILGQKIDSEHMPVLYKWAKVNPEGLAKTLKSMSEKDGSLISTNMVMLESDMQTDND